MGLGQELCEFYSRPLTIDHLRVAPEEIDVQTFVENAVHQEICFSLPGADDEEDLSCDIDNGWMGASFCAEEELPKLAVADVDDATFLLFMHGEASTWFRLRTQTTRQ